MGKKFALISLLLILCFTAFAGTSVRTFLPSLAEEPIYPIDETIGQTVPNDYSQAHTFLSKALSTPFDLSWCETFISPQSRKNITTLYSSILSELTEGKSFLLSRAFKNADDSYSISVRFINDDNVLTFVILDNYIVGITSKKNNRFEY